MANERFARAKQLAMDHLEDFARELWQARERDRSKARWQIADPYRTGAHPHNLSLFLSGPKRGGWQDFESGIKGDALDFVAHGLTGTIDSQSRLAAVRFIEDRFGLGKMDDAQRARIASESKARRIAAEAEAERMSKRQREQARKRFYGGSEPIQGTIGERYFAARGCPLDLVPNLSGAIRFVPEAEYWMDAVWQKQASGRDVKIQSGPIMPAIMTGMVDGEGRIGANHMTFLSASGRAKAAVDKAKLMYPATTGLVMRLTNGPSGMGAERAAAKGVRDVVALTEGIEDGLTAAMSDCDLRVWACGSLAGLGTVPDHACAAGFMIFQDNDWGKAQAQAQFERAVARLRTFGKPVEIVSVPDELGKDLNDVVKPKNENQDQ